MRDSLKKFDLIAGLAGISRQTAKGGSMIKSIRAAFPRV
jgi:hypothetical protein